MQKISLEGVWDLRLAEKEITIPGRLPGCNYLDMLENKQMEDPFWDRNEEEASKLAEQDYEYSREFMVSDQMMEEDKIRLVISGLDTFGEIYVNNKKVAETKNAHRTYRYPIKEYLHAGQNNIRLYFHSPYPFMEKKEQEDKLPSMGGGKPGVSHVRKPQCHFGWDWGPCLPPVGVSGEIFLEGYHLAKIENIQYIQKHLEDKVELTIRPEIWSETRTDNSQLTMQYTLTDPKGRTQKITKQCSTGKAEVTFSIVDPFLWWSNGLGEAFLYEVVFEMFSEEGEALGSLRRKIGLRTITLNTDKDKWGNNFQFVINKVPVFIKGADWIPPDSFVTRADEETLDFYVKSAKEANMNMLRIWGGGYYAPDTFYDLCDRYGILVWQDFGFACAAYPFYDKEFLKNVKLEVRDNVNRIRHHASLAVWCGNNEIELMGIMWRKNKKLGQAIQEFFHKRLPAWLRMYDDTTAYWPGSPSSGDPKEKGNRLDKGDSHLWQIWHGMQPIEGYEKFPTRFCTEFGMEAFPSMETIAAFTDRQEISIFDPTMLAHQKSGGGNQKILFYMLAKFREPKKFEDFVYLSQIVQGETIKQATEIWRRRLGRCNGALYWQYNDCWPVASWAGIDYGRQFKALQYMAKRFNRMCAISFVQKKEQLGIYVHNEYPKKVPAVLQWEVQEMDGSVIAQGEKRMVMKGFTVKAACVLEIPEILQHHRREDVIVTATLEREGGAEKNMEWCDKKTQLLLPDRKVHLQKAEIGKRAAIKEGKVVLTLTSPVFARYVEVKVDGVSTPVSDNYFDLEGGRPYTITFAVPDGRIKSEQEWECAVHIKTLADIEYKNNGMTDQINRLKMRFYKQNLFSWLIFKFI